ncbi:efflux RND transporter periplasmic adaptor subunit [Thiohalocapsa marina]|uniref:Efflux RND transporter periplasmic adaptor subunit n=1 Tax=Thiohalocapsa marina TaxID=424902 RepID=A0A5M8FP31_9GAMM|nr:efflux RND transporter periplasmic adaptor subunit [Thiohalocapsa marina]KAA6184175.1 efflux RND transporter periplasmic adaptor subunit [Thiohalocapsa marina]
MIKRLLLVLLFLAALLAGLGYLKFQQIQGQIALFSQPAPPKTVLATRVETSTWQPRLHSVGDVQGAQGVLVNNQVAGQVQNILFESGDLVQAGQPLVQLDTEVDAADLAGLMASLELAETQLKRNQKLLRDRAVSQDDFDEISAQVSQAKAQVQAKRALIEKKTIRAPFDGQLGIRRVDLGQFLPAGSAIVELEALDPVYVDFALPERHLARLHTGQTVRITVTAYPGQMFEGQIQAINPTLDRNTRNVRVRALLQNPERQLRPGMFAQVETLLPARDQVLTLPREAITFNTYGDSVFVIQQKDTDTEPQLQVQRRQIRTGEVHADRIEILDGLEAGERVVAVGHVKLRNGDQVRIAEDDKPADQAPAPAGAPAP